MSSGERPSTGHPAGGEVRGRLTRRQRAVLDFERNWQAHEGRKEPAIRERLRMSPTTYYHVLAELLDMPAARAYDPLVVARLRRRREQRARQAAGHVDHGPAS